MKKKQLRTLREPIRYGICVAVVAAALTIAMGTAVASDPVPDEESLIDVYPKRDDYSPYTNRNFPTNVYWGDTHVHTGMSMDAGAFGARLQPADAYQFARGEQVTSSTGQRVKLSRPLDFLVVTDHSDNMGFFPKLLGGDPSMLADPTGRRWYDMINAGGQEGVKAAIEIIQALTGNKMPKALASLPGTELYRSTWEATTKPPRTPTTLVISRRSSVTNGPRPTRATTCTAMSSIATTPCAH